LIHRRPFLTHREVEEGGARVKELRIGVLGPGAVGGLLAALGANHGADVTCIASPLTSETILLKGISVKSNRFGNFRTNLKSESVLTNPLDLLCVTIKATSLGEALDRIPPAVLGPALVVPFLNGLEHVAMLQERFPLAVVVPATIRIESTLRAPGEIEQLSSLARIDIACTVAIKKRIAPFVKLLGDVGFEVRCRDDGREMLWEKLGFLAPLALLTTAYDSPIGAVRTDHRSELIAVVNEIALVARAEGAALEPSDILLQLDSIPASMQSSMQRDARAGRPYEIEAVGGAILRCASTHKITVPITQRLVNSLRPN
jgi:2-dehydropantoate 2-reductase